MNGNLPKLAIVTLASAMLIGCSSNEYNPTARPTQLAASAAGTEFPANLQPEENAKLISTLNPMTNQLTIRNFGDQALSNIDVWVNQVYVLHADRIDPNNSRVFKLSDFYNRAGNSLESAPAGSIHRVQVATQDGRGSKLYNVQGPQIEQ